MYLRNVDEQSHALDMAIRASVVERRASFPIEKIHVLNEESGGILGVVQLAFHFRMLFQRTEQCFKNGIVASLGCELVIVFVDRYPSRL
jgi:hypothetical protein